MPVIIPERRVTPVRGIGRRLAWFVVLYAGGVATVGLVAWLLRLWIKP